MKEREKIRYRLSVNHLSFAWLIDMLRKRGIETNGPVLSAILAGTRNGPSVDKIIAESIDILDWYERQPKRSAHSLLDLSESFSRTKRTASSSRAGTNRSTEHRINGNLWFGGTDNEKGIWSIGISLVFLPVGCGWCGRARHDGSRYRHGAYGYRPWLLLAVL